MGGRDLSNEIRTAEAGESLQKIESQIENVLQRMESLARFATPAFYDADKARQYYEAKYEHDELRSRRETLLNRQIKQNQNRNIPQKTFVNSFGEATKRELTTSTYKRRQKQLMKRIETLLGR